MKFNFDNYFKNFEKVSDKRQCSNTVKVLNLKVIRYDLEVQGFKFNRIGITNTRMKLLRHFLSKDFKL